MKKVVIIGLFIAVALTFVPMFSYAQEGLVPCGVGDSDAPGYVTCGFCHLFQLINNILNWVMLVIIPIIAPIFIVIGGIMMLVAGGTPVEIFKDTGTQGNPKLYSQAKGVITAVIVGLIIIYTAWVILMTILNFLGVATWTGLIDNPFTPEKEGWWQIQCLVS